MPPVSEAATYNEFNLLIDFFTLTAGSESGINSRNAIYAYRLAVFIISILLTHKEGLSRSYTLTMAADT